ncbi:MAG: ABC transporter ATP-binding protein/permease [Sediminibacterium sp.]|jgi:ATP-binding cassette subfamily B multidrug efflux pump|nr:ABC transporter ATP-binding protein/permease [Sediminibacterium sp.]
MSKSAPKKVFSFLLLVRVFKFVKPYRALFYGSVLLAIVMAIFAPVRPYLIQLTVDMATGKTVHIPCWLKLFIAKQNLSDASKFIIAVTLFQVVFLFVETTIRFFFSFMTAALGQRVVKDLRIAVYEKIVGLNLHQFDTTPIGTLTTRTIDDIERINDIFSDGLIPIIADLLTIIFTLATMFWINWQLTLVSLAPFPIMIIATYFFKESVNKSFVEVRNAVASLNAFIQEHLSGMAVVQAFAAEGRELNKFKKINAEHRLANIKAIFAYSVFFPIVEVVLAISTGLLVWFIAGNALDAGLLMSFILYLNQLFRPLRVIADKFNVLQMGMVAAERVFKVMDNPDEMPPDSPDCIDAGVLKGNIDFKDIWFAYKEDQYVLKGINFSIQSGQTVALVGHTGSGKTSIISLLNRLYTTQKGSLLLDQKPITAYTLESLRRNIGVVLQDVFLFSGSILDNITLRNPAITEEEVVKAAKMMGLHDFIMQLPDGYQYHVMERGATLSLGQRQLISFIRALLYNPSVLVLDEATSSVDSETELLIEKATETLITGRTSIVIAHRLSTIRKADLIIVLDKGEVKEAGNHESLLQKDGFYARLYEMQFEKKDPLSV